MFLNHTIALAKHRCYYLAFIPEENLEILSTIHRFYCVYFHARSHLNINQFGIMNNNPSENKEKFCFLHWDFWLIFEISLIEYVLSNLLLQVWIVYRKLSSILALFVNKKLYGAFFKPTGNFDIRTILNIF